MALEDITAGHTIANLVITNPADGDDVSQGDDHLRNFKKALQYSFPNISATASGVAAEFAFAHKGGTVSGNVVILGSLSVSGAMSVASTLSVSGAATIKGALSAEGAATLASTLSVSGAAVLKSTLSVVGAATIARTTLTDAVNIAWNLASNQVATVTLGGNRTLDNPTNMINGGNYELIVKQDATGSRTLAYGTAYKWPGGVVPVLSTAANAIDLLTFTSDGTSMFGVFSKGFA